MKCISGYIILLISYVYFANALPFFFHGRPRGGMLGSPKVSKLSSLKIDPKDEQWYTQKLDHFNPADSRTWQQRYFVNDKYFKTNGPIFLMIGGEGSADPIWMVEGQWIKYAEEHQALCVMLEHRFYGKSHPTEDLSVSNLQYLSSEQALADLATFHQYIVEKHMLSNKNRWISIGGSYPGSLSAWFRLKYPHLVYGALAASAPMWGLVDFQDYLVVVRDSLSSYSEKCNGAINEAINVIQDMVKSQTGRDTLKKVFRLCDAIETQDDVDNFFEAVAGNFEGVVQYNNDNRAFEGALGTNITIKVVCDTMLDSTLPDPFSRIVKVNDILMAVYNQSCLDAGYQSMISQLSKTSWNDSASEGGRQWTYQTCVEFGFFQSSNSTMQPFGNNFPASFFVKQCADIFGATFSADLLTNGIAFTNSYYGGEMFQGSRVLFINGAIDPWHALSFTSSPPNNNSFIFMSTTAHCADMYPDSDSDPQELTDARKKISSTIGEWLQ